MHCAVVYVCGLDIMLLNLNLFEPLSLYCLPSVGGRVNFNTKKVPIIMMISRCIFCLFLTRVYFYVFYLKIQKIHKTIQPHFEKQPKFELTIK